MVTTPTKNSKLIFVDDIQEAINISNYYAPEHLIINCKNAEKLVEKISSAGSVFLGEWSPESAGDYCSGTNHVLPTDQTAKCSSGLGVDDYMKKTVFIDAGNKTLKKISKPTVELARQEGLEAHALSVEIRKIKT